MLYRRGTCDVDIHRSIPRRSCQRRASVLPRFASRCMRATRESSLLSGKRFTRTSLQNTHSGSNDTVDLRITAPSSFSCLICRARGPDRFSLALTWSSQIYTYIYIYVRSCCTVLQKICCFVGLSTRRNDGGVAPLCLYFFFRAPPKVG